MSNKISGTFSANGSSTQAVIEMDGAYIHGVGDFGHGIVALQILLGDNVTWSDVEGHRYNSNFSDFVQLPFNSKARLTISDASSPNVQYEIFSQSKPGSC